MRRTALVVAALVLLSGCSGLTGGPTPTASATDEPARYGVAVESEYATEQQFTLRVVDGDRTVLNRSRRLDSGELWHAVNLSEREYGDGEYGLELYVDGELDTRTTFSFRESERVTRRSGATLIVTGGATGVVHNCGGNVTCYEATRR